MKIFQKRAVNAKSKRYVVEYSSFHHGFTKDKAALYSTQAKNSDVKGGRLKTGVGLADFRPGGSSVYVLDFQTPLQEIHRVPVVVNENAGELFFYTDACGALCVYDNTAQGFKKIGSFGGIGRFIAAVNETYQTRFLFATEKGLYEYGTDGTLKRKTTKNSPSGCFFKNRLFLAEPPYTLAFSTPSNFEDFADSVDDGGRIQLPSSDGKIVLLQEFKDCVYIFREHGIWRLNASGNASEFAVKRLPYRGEKIVADSIAVCGESIFYVAGKALYAFDGEKIRRVCEHLEVDVDLNKPCSHASGGGRYFFRYTDSQGEKKMVVVDGDGENGYFSLSTDELAGGPSEVFAMLNGQLFLVEDGGFLSGDNRYEFPVRNLDFGISGRKTLRTLKVTGRGAVTVTVRTEGRGKSFDLDLSDGEATVRFDLYGKIFSLDVTLHRDSHVDKISVEIETLRGGTNDD